MRRQNLKDKVGEIKKEEVIQNWIEDTAENTQKAYLHSMALFSILNNKTPTEMLEIAEEEQDERLPTRKRQLTKWIDNLKEYLKENNVSKHTAKTRKTNVSSFFHFYEIDTPQDYKQRRKKNKLKIKNERPGLKKEDIKDAVSAAKSFKLKSLILTQATSGLCQEDVLNLTIKQFEDGLIELDKDIEICLIRQEREKSGVEHYTFISYEAVELIKKYLKLERNNPSDYLFSSTKNKNTRYNNESYGNTLRTLNKNLGWATEKWKYNKLTSHMLRKFFETQLTDAGCISEHVTHMMGWKLPGMRAHYYLAHPEELQKSYIKHLDYLTLENIETVTLDSPEVKKIKENYDLKLAERDKEINDIKKDLERLNKYVEVKEKAEERKKHYS